MLRGVIRGWQHSPNNAIYLCARVLNCENWRTIEVEGEEHTVCDVRVGDPADHLGGKVYEEVHITVVKSQDSTEDPGLVVSGIGRDDR